MENCFLNSREIAVVFWASFFICVALSSLRVRESIRSVFISLFRGPILIGFSLSALYIVGEISFLKGIGFWELALLKDSILWALFSGVPLILSASTGKSDKSFFRSILVSNLKIIILLEFVISFYVFPLWGELLLVPLVFVIVLMEEFSKLSEENLGVGKFCRFLLVVIGSAISSWAIYSVICDYTSFRNLLTFKQFVLPILLMILYFPFLYCLQIYILYEGIYVRLGFNLNNDTQLRRYAKKRVFTTCLMNLTRLRRFETHFYVGLMSVETKDDFDLLVEKTLCSQE